MWTSKNRGRYDRSALRYPSDRTDGSCRSGCRAGAPGLSTVSAIPVAFEVRARESCALRVSTNRETATCCGLTLLVSPLRSSQS
jgi:hypothetical protein